MKWRVTFFGLALVMLIASGCYNSVWLLLGAAGAAFFAAIKWW